MEAWEPRSLKAWNLKTWKPAGLVVWWSRSLNECLEILIKEKKKMKKKRKRKNLTRN